MYTILKRKVYDLLIFKLYDHIAENQGNLLNDRLYEKSNSPRIVYFKIRVKDRIFSGIFGKIVFFSRTIVPFSPMIVYFSPMIVYFLPMIVNFLSRSYTLSYDRIHFYSITKYPKIHFQSGNGILI